MIFSIFDQDSKIIIGHLTCSEQDIDLIRSFRSDIVEGYYEPKKFKIENNQVIPFTEDIDENLEISNQLRSFRNQLLSAVDRINPVWYASLGAQEQTDLVVYRQQLLDVPQQAGFPTQVEWPAKPAWL
jgi:Phage tail assembly chaperone protein